jgi:DNA helicase-2/ATP-dependent DNA helicase PcrA
MVTMAWLPFGMAIGSKGINAPSVLFNSLHLFNSVYSSTVILYNESNFFERIASLKEKKIQLNDRQWQAVRHGDGPMLVLAGPGSGKTTVITCRIHYMIRRLMISPGKILVVTFSKSAAEQMQRRFQGLDENSNCSGVTFGTFHAVFFKFLREYYRYSLENVLRENERREIIKKILTERQLYIDDEFLTSVTNEISLVKNEMFDLSYYNSACIGTDEFRLLYAEYESFKRDTGKIDFDDMLILCYNLFNTEPQQLERWQARYPYIMIDEFQDINHVQYECIRLLSAPNHHLFAVGDDDQSIYRFRGSRPEFLLRFPEDYAGTQQVVLDTNYRSTNEIIEFSNKLIAENQIRFNKTITGTNKKGAPPVFIVSDDQTKEARGIAVRILSMLKQGADLNEIAVIYRVNIQSRALSDALMQMNIPYQVKDEAPSVYEHWIARDIHAYLRVSQHQKTTYEPDAERITSPTVLSAKPFWKE